MTPALAALATMLLYQLLRNQFDRLATNTDLVLPVAILVLAGSMVFARVTYTNLPDTFRILARATAAGTLFYLFVEPPSFTLANPVHAHLAAYVDLGYWAALLTGILGIWRPSFDLLPSKGS